MKNKQNKHLKIGLIALGVVLLLGFVSAYGISETTMSSGMNGIIGGMGNMMKEMSGEMMNECHEAMESEDMGKMRSMMQKHMG